MKLFANRLTFEFQDGGRMVDLLRAIVSTPFSFMLFLFSNERVLSQATEELSPVLQSTSMKKRTNNKRKPTLEQPEVSGS